MSDVVDCKPGAVVNQIVDGVYTCVEIGYFASQPLTAYILLVSAAAALYALYSNKVIARKRATVDIVMHDSASKKVKKAKAIVQDMKGNGLAQLGDAFEKDPDKRKAILFLLNHYEFMAVGVNSGAFDKQLLQELKHSSIVSTYDNLYICILMLRKERKVETIFQDFELLVKDFKKKPLKVKVKE